MSLLKDKIEGMISDFSLQRPTSVTGKIIGIDHSNRTVTVEAINPKGPGLIRLADLVMPEIMPSSFYPMPEVGSHATVIFPDHNFQFGQIIAIKPPNQNWIPSKSSLSKERTWTFPINFLGL
jgi:hypothetical protein